MESERTLTSPAAQEGLGADGIAAIIILLIASVSIRNWLPASSVAVPLLRAVWVILYIGATVILMRRFGAQWLVWMLRHQPMLCILLAAAAVSCLWSLAPLVSLQKALSLAGTTVLGVFIGYTCPPRRLMHLLFWAFALLIVSGVLADLFLPAVLTRAIGSRGIMGHKNTFGMAAALATIFFLVVTQRRDVSRAWGTILCVLSVVALIQTRSRTSLAATIATFALLSYLWIAAALRRPVSVVLRRLAVALVVCVSVLPFFVGPLAAALGNDDPLNGRTRLWAGVSTILSERPLTGYGYETVWARSDETLLPHIPITAHRSAATAHNSVLHIASELGIPVAVVACFYLFTCFADSIRQLDHAPSSCSVFTFSFLFFFAVDGFAEANLLRIHSMFWILFVALTVATKLEALEQTASPTTPSARSRCP